MLRACGYRYGLPDNNPTLADVSTYRLIEPKNLFRCSDAIGVTSQGATHCIAERQRASAGAAGVGRGGAFVEGKRRGE